MPQFNPALLLSELKLGAKELRRNRSPWDVSVGDVNARRALQIIKHFRFCFISSLISRLNTCVVQLMVKALKCPHSAPLICMLTYEKSHSRTGIRLKKLCTFFLSDSQLCILISCTLFPAPLWGPYCVLRRFSLGFILPLLLLSRFRRRLTGCRKAAGSFTALEAGKVDLQCGYIIWANTNRVPEVVNAQTASHASGSALCISIT